MNPVRKALSTVTKFLISSGGNANRAFGANLSNPSEYSQSEIIDNVKGTAAVCADIRAKRVRRVEWQSVRNGEPAEESNLLNLLENPNPEIYLTKSKLMELSDIAAFYTGEWFWLLELGKSSKFPMRIWPARPDMMEISRNSAGEIIGFVFTNDKGERIPMTREEVVFYRTSSVNNYYRGVGVVERAIDSIQTEDYVRRYTKRHLFNNATPSGIVSLKGNASQISKEEFKEVERKFNKKYGNLDNAGRIAFIREAEMSFEKIGSSITDLNPEVLSRLAREDIQRAAQIPDQLMGQYSDSNYNNSREANRSFKEDVILPIIEDYTDVINMTLGAKFEEELELKTTVEMSLEDRIKDQQAKLNAENGFLSLNQYLVEQGYPTIDDPSADTIYRPANSIPVATVERPEDPTQKKISSNVVTVKAKYKTVTSKKKVQKGFEPKSVTKVIDRKAVIWKALDAISANWEDAFEAAVAKLRSEQETAMIAAVKINGIEAFEGTLDIDEEVDRWTIRLFPIYMQIARSQEEATKDLIGTIGNESLITKEFENRIRDRAERFVRELTKQTIKDIQAIIAKKESEELKKALSNTVVLEELMTYWDDTDYRVRRIARTESAKASNAMAVETYRQSPYVTAKEWYANPGACEFCVAMNGKTISLEDSFAPIGGSIQGVDDGIFQTNYETVSEPPLHPNCRCRALPWSKAFEDTGNFFEGDINPFDAAVASVTSFDVMDKAQPSLNEKQFINNEQIRVQSGINDPQFYSYSASGAKGRYDPLAKTIYVYDKDKAREVFYHELGHAVDIDMKSKILSSTDAKDAILSEGTGITVRRLKEISGLSTEQARKLLRGEVVAVNVKGIGPDLISLTRADRQYMTSASEVFSEGYAQYRMNPTAFKKYAPKLFSIYQGLF